MDRRAVICGLVSLAAGVPTLAHAQSLDDWRLFENRKAVRARAWKKNPSITVVAGENDFRIPHVDEAVKFWNYEFAKLFISFRLGPIALAEGAVIPLEELQSLSDRFGSRNPPSALPESLQRVAGDIIVALADGEFVSFGYRWPGTQKALAAIQSHALLKNRPASIFVIAHELGHVVGLYHNAEPGTLMCGVPASCAGPKGWDLTNGEKTTLLEMYPPRLAG
jgi:hypothetical protein